MINPHLLDFCHLDFNNPEDGSCNIPSANFDHVFESPLDLHSIFFYNNNDRLDDALFKNAVRSCPDVQVLSIPGCLQLTDESCHAMARGWPGLKGIRLCGARFTADGLASLFSGCRYGVRTHVLTHLSTHALAHLRTYARAPSRPPTHPASHLLTAFAPKPPSELQWVDVSMVPAFSAGRLVLKTQLEYCLTYHCCLHGAPPSLQSCCGTSHPRCACSSAAARAWPWRRPTRRSWPPRARSWRCSTRAGCGCPPCR